MYRELSFSSRYKIISYFTAAFIFIGGVYLIIKPNTTLFEHRVSFVLPIASILYIAGVLRKRVMITQEAIISVTTFSKKQMALDEIEGIKIEEESIILIPHSPHKKDLYIHGYKQLKDNKLLVEVLQGAYHNIDLIRQHQGIANQAYDFIYGFTPEQRFTELKKFNKMASFINALGLIFGLTVFIPFTIFQAIAIALPLLCIILVLITNNRLKLTSKFGAAAYPVIGTAYIIPIFTLFFKSFLSYDLYSLKNIWVPSLTFGGLIIILYYFINMDELPDIKKSRELITMGLLFMAYAFASIRIINCAFDSSPGQVYTPSIIKHETSEHWEAYNTTKDYDLTLTAWGPNHTSGEIEVNRGLYEQTRAGDKVHITIKPGLLNIPWYVVGK